ncbi:MAG: hypothetical protein ACI9MC_003479 [Kiritimatiellia bacterium]
MATKTCPSCGTDVPSVAKRCRECFHDFTSQHHKPNSNVLLVLLGFLAIASLLGAGTLFAITTFRLDQKIQVNQESHYIITTTRYVGGISTDRVAFADIASVEHTIVGNGWYLVVAIKTDGTRMIIEKGKKPRKGIAERYAKVMTKPFIEVDNTTGFFSNKDGPIEAVIPEAGN